MGSAGKWVLGLLLLVVGAVAVARTVSSDGGNSDAVVREGTPLNAQQAAAASAAQAADAAKKAAPAADVACKKACVEEPEIAEGAIGTQKIAPGSVTLSKLAFEVPNLNELENEINARKAAEAAAAAGREALAAETAKNDAAITAAAQNGITAEAAARTSEDQKIREEFAAADAGLVSKLNQEIADRQAGDDALQLSLNNEIQARQNEMNALKGELADASPTSVAIIQINSHEIVDGAVSAADLGLASVVGGFEGDVKDESIDEHDIKNGSVRSAEILDLTIVDGDIANTTITAGKLVPNTLTKDQIGEDAITNSELADDAVISANIFNGTIILEDLHTPSINLLFATDAELADEAATRSLADIGLANFDASLGVQVNGGTPNSTTPGDALIEWSRLKGVPLGFADNVDNDGAGDLRSELDAPDASSPAANDGDGLVHWTNIDGIDADVFDRHAASITCTDCVSSGEIASLATSKLDGTILASQLAGDIDGGLIKNGSITAADLAGEYSAGPIDTATQIEAGAVTSAKIADGQVLSRDLADDAVTVAKLGADVDALFAGLNKRIDDLATPAGTAGTGTETVHHSRAGFSVHTASVPADVPITVGARQAVALPVTGVNVGDFVTVSPPAALSGNLVFGGATVTALDIVTVYVYNPGPAASVLKTDEWQVMVLDQTP